MLVKEYIQYNVHELAQQIKAKKTSAEEVLECALIRCQEVNPSLNAVVTNCSDFATSCLSKMKGDEPYYGVPLLVKDLGFDLNGMPATEGSRFFAHNRSSTNSDMINQLIALGFVPFAKTNTPELGLSYVTESALFGPCHNPFDLTRTAGGSSGGSAAAVAAGIAPIATASDGGGSIRIPAACCGLFGFKPTTGLTATGPWSNELWSGMATHFILTKSVRDTSALFNRLTQSQGPVAPKTLKVAYLEGAFAPVPVDPIAEQAVSLTDSLLQDLGHQLVRIPIELDLAAIGQCTLDLIAANTAAMIKAQVQALGREPRADELEPITWDFYRLGMPILASDLINTKAKLYQLMRPLHQVLQQVDVVLTPALAQFPIPIGSLSTKDEFNTYLQKNTEFSPFTSLFNQAGLPAMTLPVMRHEALSVSVQMGAGLGKDRLLLDLALQLEKKLA